MSLDPPYQSIPKRPLSPLDIFIHICTMNVFHTHLYDECQVHKRTTQRIRKHSRSQQSTSTSTDLSHQGLYPQHRNICQPFFMPAASSDVGSNLRSKCPYKH